MMRGYTSSCQTSMWNANKRKEERRVRKMIESKGIKKMTVYSMILVDEFICGWGSGASSEDGDIQNYGLVDGSPK